MERHPNIPESAWQFLAELSCNDSVDALILFGSRAFGDHEERSDVDVAVCGATITRLQWAQFKDAAHVAPTLYWISLVHFDRNPISLRQRITETGVTVYVRTKASR